MKLLSLKLFFGLLFFSFFVRPTFVQSFTNPLVYQITTGIPDSPTNPGAIYFTKEFDLVYTVGPVIFGHSPLGSTLGGFVVDDGVKIKVTKPNGTENTFTQTYHFNCLYRQQKSPQNISNFFGTGINHVKVTLFDICGTFKYSPALYLVTENLIPSPTPSPTPTPSPSAPEPFLNLPWDYGDKDFKDIVYDPNSWFDHNYPLQNVKCCTQEITDYTGQLKTLPYKSHSGYDYGSGHGVVENTPVLAAASGTAIFIAEANSGGAGNMVKIDHGNGYQTWYEHLEEVDNDGIGEDDQLIVDEEGKEVDVEQGEKIGRVGLTGNTTGYHIHLSVFKDINDNDDFNDDKPFGLVDPLGWEGDYTDPWEEYSVTDENEVTRHGAKSYKLFTELTPPKTQQVPPSGGTITDDKFKLNIPNNASDITLNYKIEYGPFEKAAETIKSILPSLFLSATNTTGQLISNFNNPLSLLYNYSKADLTNINEDTISFYFFNPQTSIWEKISSTLDKTNKTISAPTNHFSQFAVMGEVLDSTPPTTTAEVIGEKGAEGWYRSSVSVKLTSEDNSDGKGVSYTVYSLDNEHWDKYETPVEFRVEGNHKIYFLSHDRVGNQEQIKTVEFSIDKTPPEINTGSPKDNDIYLLNQEGIFADYSCSDKGGSGLQSCQGSVENGGNINTQSVGENAFRVEAVDNAGNLTAKDVLYKVQYNSTGLCYGEAGHTILQPINPDGTSIFKQGSTIPAKFRVCHNGVPVSDPNLVKSFNLIKSTSGTSATNVNEPVDSTNPDPNFRFDPTKQQWIFNMNTKNLLAGNTYFYKILLNDLTDIQFNFGLR